MTGLEIFKDVPVLTEENCEEVLPDKEYVGEDYYKELKDCVDVLQKKYKNIVTGFWYIKELDMDGGTMFICRTKEKVSDLYGKIHLDILLFTHHAFLYDMTDADIGDLSYLPVDRWLKHNLIYALYDIDRRIG